MALPFLFSPYSELLAKTFYYHRASKSCIYDLHILPGALWGGIFQVPVAEEPQVTGGNGRSFSGREV